MNVFLLISLKFELDSNDVFRRLLEEILKNKYSRTTFYCNNLGNYDAIFIIKILVEYNSEKSVDKHFNFKPIFIDGSIISLSISRGRNKKNRGALALL